MTEALPPAQPVARALPRRRPSALLKLTRVEFTLFLRERVGPVSPVIGFPLLLLVIFGAIPSFRQVLPGSGGLTVLDSYLPILIVYIARAAVPRRAAADDGQLPGARRAAATADHPGEPLRVLGAQLIVHFVMATLVTLAALEVVARLAYGVAFPAPVRRVGHRGGFYVGRPAGRGAAHRRRRGDRAGGGGDREPRVLPDDVLRRAVAADP